MKSVTIAVFTFVFILCISFVSAAWWNDFQERFSPSEDRYTPSQVIVNNYLQWGSCSSGDDVTSWFDIGGGRIYHCIKKEQLSIGQMIVVDSVIKRDGCPTGYETTSYFIDPDTTVTYYLCQKKSSASVKGYAVTNSYLQYESCSEDTPYTSFYDSAGGRIFFCQDRQQILDCEGSTCGSECELGERRCIEGNYQVCEDLNGDGRADWSRERACTGGKVCSEGNCVLQCTDDCFKDEQACVAGKRKTCGNYDQDPCLEWSIPIVCPTGEVCLEGSCASVAANRPLSNMALVNDEFTTGGCSAGTEQTSYFDHPEGYRVYHCVTRARVGDGQLFETEVYLSREPCLDGQTTSWFSDLIDKSKRYIYSCKQTNQFNEGMTAVGNAYVQYGACSEGDESIWSIDHPEGKIWYCRKYVTLTQTDVPDVEPYSPAEGVYPPTTQAVSHVFTISGDTGRGCEIEEAFEGGSFEVYYGNILHCMFKKELRFGESIPDRFYFSSSERGCAAGDKLEDPSQFQSSPSKKIIICQHSSEVRDGLRVITNAYIRKSEGSVCDSGYYLLDAISLVDDSKLVYCAAYGSVSLKESGQNPSGAEGCEEDVQKCISEEDVEICEGGAWSTEHCQYGCDRERQRCFVECKPDSASKCLNEKTVGVCDSGGVYSESPCQEEEFCSDGQCLSIASQCTRIAVASFESASQACTRNNPDSFCLPGTPQIWGFIDTDCDSNMWLGGGETSCCLG